MIFAIYTLATVKIFGHVWAVLKQKDLGILKLPEILVGNALRGDQMPDHFSSGAVESESTKSIVFGRMLKEKPFEAKFEGDQDVSGIFDESLNINF